MKAEVHKKYLSGTGVLPDMLYERGFADILNKIEVILC